MKFKIVFLVFFCSLSLFAQSVDEYVNNYYKETNKIITESVSTLKSCYPEIEEKIKNSERDTIGWYLIEEGIHLSEKAFHNLTPKEHFVYALFIPEAFNQSCYISFYPENRFQKIVPFLKSINFSFVTSTRQLEKLKKHKEISIELIKECFLNKNISTENLKHLIVDLDAFELIPDLLKITENQKERKDPNIMTVLCLLMKDEYKPFKESQIYKDLYVIDDSVEFNNRTLRDRTIPFTWKNYNKIVKFAEDYYQFKTSNKN